MLKGCWNGCLTEIGCWERMLRVGSDRKLIGIMQEEEGGRNSRRKNRGDESLGEGR